MEKLSRQVSNIFETPSELCAVIPSFKSGIVNGVAFFEFMSSDFAPIIRVEWPADSDVALVEKDVAAALVKNRWARHLSDEEAEAYNAAVEAYILATEGPAKTQEPEPPAVVTEPAPVVEPPVVVAEPAPPVADPFVAFGVASPAKPDVVSSPSKPGGESSSKRR